MAGEMEAMKSRSPVHRVDKSEGAVLRERRNWRIFAAFARQEYSDCLQIIEEQLCACSGLEEYPIYVKGEHLSPGTSSRVHLSCGSSLTRFSVYKEGLMV